MKLIKGKARRLSRKNGRVFSPFSYETDEHKPTVTPKSSESVDRGWLGHQIAWSKLEENNSTIPESKICTNL